MLDKYSYTDKKQIAKSTPQKKLEDKRFTLEVNLYSIRLNIYMIIFMALTLYATMFNTFFEGKIEIELFIMASLMAAAVVVFSYLLEKDFVKHKLYIKSIESLFEKKDKENNNV